MKARFGSVEVEGPPHEIAALIRDMQGDGGAVASPKRGGKAFVSEDVAFKVLKRRALSPGQTAMLKLLRRNHPSWTTAHDLQKATQYDANQLAGLLGAFGKRVAATEGYAQGTWFLDQEWDYEQDCNKYRLPETVLAAVGRAGI